VLSDVPRVAEFLPSYEANTWGVASPRTRLPKIVYKLNKEINATFADPATRARFSDLGGTLPGSLANREVEQVIRQYPNLTSRKVTAVIPRNELAPLHSTDLFRAFPSLSGRSRFWRCRACPCATSIQCCAISNKAIFVCRVVTAIRRHSCARRQYPSGPLVTVLSLRCAIDNMCREPTVDS
jgi:hypothetical protein